jgi:arabinan endo-1,5-alpha-L-arabinosidase
MDGKLFLLILVFLLILSAGPVQADYEELTGNYRVHDPVMARQGDTYYVFCTGRRIPILKSTDMHSWQSAGRALNSIPAWAFTAVPAFTGSSVWAPDISFFNGKYHLYYSVSTFGSNISAIGLATNTTLDSSDRAYQWIDSGGSVITTSARSSYNAIDPALFIDSQGEITRYWLALGSFWRGIKLTEIDPSTGYPLQNPPVLYSIATRVAPPNAIEAPFIVFRNGYYYLFVSFDFCCRGVNSTYNVRFGRADSVTGPYIDRDGISMMNAGGTQLTWPDERWKGPGHNAVFLDTDGSYWLLHHAYDAQNNGRSYLRIHELFWTLDGWPSLTEPNCADVHSLGFGLTADWTQDCYVDFYDLAFLADAWLNDFYWQDIADLAAYWLQCNNPADANCTANW